MIDKTKLIRVAPKIAPFADLYVQKMQEADITPPLRAAHFLGQCYVESAGFTATRESLNYAADSAMMGKFIKWGRITPAQAQQYARTSKHPADQRALANILYGGAWGKKNLGNVEPNDGWDFRGGGHKQLTGRDNYTRFSKAYYGDLRLVENPGLLNEADAAVSSAIWFWTANGLNAIADTGSVEAVTKKVNGGYTDLEKRRQWTNKFLAELRG